ncbi:MAG: S1 RNA-binding domain-containing protein [Planctomycetes bacterium]|nr:S1 RNA-binding domain-containing protein [Planctomycetota bacterium]
MASTATLDRLLAEFDTPPETTAAVVALLEERASPAYIARYRRWAIGNLAEDRIQAMAERLHTLTDLEQRKLAIAQQAQERGRWTPELEATLATTVDQDFLDDLYQSMRPRRRGIAVQMEEKGLLPLAMALQHRQLGDVPLQETAASYLSAEHGLGSPEQVLEGALLILADRIAHDPATRGRVRDELRRGILRARAVAPDQSGAQRYKDFLDFAEPIQRIPAGRMLALRRAEREGILQLELTLPEGRHRELLRELHGADLVPETQLYEFYQLVFDQAWQMLQETCSRDVRRRLKEKADREAVRTYGRNLRSQLMSPPLGHKKVLSLRTSSKSAWAVLLAEDGSVAQHKTLPLESDEQKQGSLAWLVEVLRTEQPAAIAIPHGRRQAGSEKLIAELRAALGETPLPMLVPVDEAGVRTAISIGRRLQDPLLELARMDMRTLGIGQTLDDVHQGMLQRELASVTASCLAAVGVDLNTATQDLLEQLPELTAEQAHAIVEHRRRIGGFATRTALAEVPNLDPMAVRNLLGLVRVAGGSEPLDDSPIHPEDYPIVQAIAARRNVPATELLGANLRDVSADDVTIDGVPRARVVGVLQQLQRAKEDVRGVLTPTRNEGVNTIADLRADQELRGRVASLTEFGAFVDLGIGQDGLAHISQIPGHRLRDPQHMLRVGEVVTVWVLHVDQQNQKIALSMHKPRHLQEGRLPTIGERMEQQGRRRHREGGPTGPTAEPRKPGRFQDSRFAGSGFPGGGFAGGGHRPERRGPPEPGDGDRRPRFGRGGPRGPGEREGGDRGFGDRGFGDRRPRGGPREQRVYTVEPAKEVVETRTHKGEVTSLASLRALFGTSPRPTPPAPPPAPPPPPPEAPTEAGPGAAAPQ